ncbi:MAG TPA: alpha/beta hydrolase-fold protein [Bacteroidota bacterium]
MKSVISLLALLMLLGTGGIGQTFQDFLNQVYSSPDSLRISIVNTYVAAHPVSPILEADSVAHFYYRGAAANVSVPGDANSWNPNAFLMSRIPPTDFWYYSDTFEPDARLDYKYVLNGSTWILDPRNPRTVSGGFGPNSEIQMPAYLPAPEISFYPGIPHGSLSDTVMYSPSLGNSRTIRVYTPPFYSASLDSFPVVVVHDGLEYVSLASANNVLDYLSQEQRIVPVIAIFVPAVNRTEEYAGSQQNQFTSFIINELMPVIDQRYRTRRDPTQRALLGASNGGNISLWIGYTHPEHFGNIAAQSSNIQTSISSGFQSSSLLPLKLYLDLGTYDIPQLIPLVRNFVPILQNKGYPFRYIEYHEGHSWGNWRAHIDNALEFFFPGAATSVRIEQEHPRTHVLLENYPNPFNAGTTIRYYVPVVSHTRLVVFDYLGRHVTTLVNRELEAGTYSLSWQPDRHASGVYFYRLEASGNVETRQMLFMK